MENMDLLNLSDFTAAKVFGYIVFSAIGLGMFIYGKKNKYSHPMIIGAVLMVYPYLVSKTLFLYLIGIALMAAAYFWRE